MNSGLTAFRALSYIGKLGAVTGSVFTRRRQPE
jgi:hypothetical protein